MEFIKKHKTLVACLIPIILVYILCNHVFMLVVVPSESMEPTIPAGSLIIARRVNRFTKIHRGEIIIFDHEGEYGKTQQYIKRVFGIPEDIVEFTQDWFAIKGQLIDVYSFMAPSSLTYYQYPDILGKDEYYVMGDNRDHSMDSRNWPYRQEVERKNIKAVAVWIYTTDGGMRIDRLEIPEVFKAYEEALPQSQYN